MLTPKLLDELTQRFGQSLPPGLHQLQAELEKNFRAIMQSTFARLELVTREEFDVQQAVLARTRVKLEQLEQQVLELEQRLSPSGAESKTKTDP